MMNDLFGDTSPDEPAFDEFAAGAVLLRGRALPPESDLLQAIDAVLAAALCAQSWSRISIVPAEMPAAAFRKVLRFIGPPRWMGKV